MADIPNSNKRTFRRRRIHKDFDLIILEKPIRAVINDISVDGIGVMLKDVINLESPFIDIKTSDPDIDTKGRAVWVSRTPDGLKAGIHMPGPIKGKLDYFRLSDILIGLQKLDKTGILEITAEGSTKQICIVNGELTLSAADPEYYKLGDFLLERGKMDAEQNLRALELMKNSGRSRVSVLLELGYITPDELIWAARYNAEKVIMGVINLDHGDFIFMEETFRPENLAEYRLNIGDLIYHGTIKTDNAEQIKKCCPPPDAVLYLPGSTEDLIRKIRIDEDGKKILSFVDGKRTLKDIVSLSVSDEMDTLKTICALSRAQVIEEVPGVSDSAGADADPKEDAGPDPETIEKIEKLYSQYRRLGYHGILGVGIDASLPEIKHAYHKMAKEFHPDRYLHFRSDSLKAKLNDLFVYINEAYRELSKARQEFYQIPVEENTHSDKDDNTKLARQRFHEGKGFLDRGQYERALTLIGQALYLDKSVAEYHFYYGIALLRNKKVKSAEESIRIAIQLDPYNSDYLTELGYIYLHLGFMTRAKHTLEKALKYDSSNKKAALGIEEAGG